MFVRVSSRMQESVWTGCAVGMVLAMTLTLTSAQPKGEWSMGTPYMIVLRITVITSNRITVRCCSPADSKKIKFSRRLAVAFVMTR